MINKFSFTLLLFLYLPYSISQEYPAFNLIEKQVDLYIVSILNSQHMDIEYYFQKQSMYGLQTPKICYDDDSFLVTTRIFSVLDFKIAKDLILCKIDLSNDGGSVYCLYSYIANRPFRISDYDEFNYLMNNLTIERNILNMSVLYLLLSNDFNTSIHIAKNENIQNDFLLSNDFFSTLFEETFIIDNSYYSLATKIKRVDIQKSIKHNKVVLYIVSHREGNSEKIIFKYNKKLDLKRINRKAT